MVVMDSTTLLLLLYPSAKPPLDPSTNAPVTKTADLPLPPEDPQAALDLKEPTDGEKSDGSVQEAGRGSSAPADAQHATGTPQPAEAPKGETGQAKA